MERLTRTKKFADLRDSFNNDAEQSITTDRLAGYEGRLNNITETLTPNIDNTYSKPSFDNNVNTQNTYTTPNFENNVNTQNTYTTPSFEDNNTNVQNVYATPKYEDNNVNTQDTYTVPSFENNVNTQNTYSTPINNNESINVIDDIDAFLHSDNSAPKYVYPNVQENNEPAFGQEFNTYSDASTTPIPTFSEQKQEDDYSVDDYFKVVSDQLSNLTTEVPEFESSGNMETYTSDLPVITDDFIKSVEQEINVTPQVEPQYTEPQVPVYTQPIVETPVNPEPVKEAPTYVAPTVEAAASNQPVIDTPADYEPIQATNSGSFLTDAIDEAKAYNKMNGQKSIDDVASSMIYDVRHNPQETVLDADEIVPVQTMERPVNNDDEFSETVSLEISKIMEDVSKPVEEELPIQEDTEFERTLTAERPDEEVVEIKNINELKAEPVRENTMSETIPFVVSDNDELLDEEYEEEESNTVLNIILIILIVILVAVLGLIIFYILKTKNIL